MNHFFRWSLLAPFALGAVGLLLAKTIWPNAVGLAAPVVFGGVPYLPFAALLWVLIGRCKTRRQLLLLSVAAPFFFLPFELIFILMLDYSSQWTFREYYNDSKMFVLFALVWGYAFVAIAWLVFLVVQCAKIYGTHVTGRGDR